MVNDTAFARLLDARVRARLRTDREYLNAENAEEQSAAEARIEEREYWCLLDELQEVH